MNGFINYNKSRSLLECSVSIYLEGTYEQTFLRCGQHTFRLKMYYSLTQHSSLITLKLQGLALMMPLKNANTINYLNGGIHLKT